MVSKNNYQIAVPKRLCQKLNAELTAKRIRKNEADKKAVLVRELMKNQSRDDLYKTWVNFSSDKLIELLGRKTYVAQIERLKEWGVIIRTNSFYAGNAPDRFQEKKPFPKAICLIDKFSSQRNCQFWRLTSNHSIEAVKRNFKLAPKTKTAKSLADFLSEFDVKISGVDYDQPVYQSAWNLENLYSIQQKKFFLTEDNFSGRIHTNFTQLASEIRGNLFCNEGSVNCVSLDISAMQPLLIGHMARGATVGRGRHTPTTMFTPFSSAIECYDSSVDVEQWIFDCENKLIYEKVRSLIPTSRQSFMYRVWGTQKWITFDIAKMDRKAFKRLMLQVIFDRNEQTVDHPVWDAIKKLYPTIAQFIWDLKTDDYKNAAKVSQIWEVEIMIHQIAAEHIRRGIPIITVHDEIITPAPDETRPIMTETFSQLGLKPTIH